MNHAASRRTAARPTVAKLLTGSLFALALGCGGDDPTSPRSVDGDVEATSIADDAPEATTENGSATTPAATPVGANSTANPPRASAPDTLATDAATAADEALAPDAGTATPSAVTPSAVADAQAPSAPAPVQSDGGAPPTAPSDPCRSEFNACFANNTVGFLDECIPNAEQCGLFPQGDGLACFTEYTTCASVNSLGWVDCVRQAETCGLVPPGADVCASQFVDCAANDLFALDQCFKAAEECGLVPLVPAGLF